MPPHFTGDSTTCSNFTYLNIFLSLSLPLCICLTLSLFPFFNSILITLSHTHTHAIMRTPHILCKCKLNKYTEISVSLEQNGTHHFNCFLISIRFGRISFVFIFFFLSTNSFRFQIHCIHFFLFEFNVLF